MTFNPTRDNWKEMAAAAKQQWSKLTDADLARIQCNEELLIGKLKELYGMSTDVAKAQIEVMRQSLKDAVRGGEMYGGSEDDTVSKG